MKRSSPQSRETNSSSGSGALDWEYGLSAAGNRSGRNVAHGDANLRGAKRRERTAGPHDDRAVAEYLHSGAWRSSQSAYETSRFELSAHSDTGGTHGGVYLGTFFCTNGACPAAPAPPTAAGQLGDEQLGDGIQVVHQVALGRPGPSNSGWSRLVSDIPSRTSPTPLARPPSHRFRPRASTTPLLCVALRNGHK
jgi:hypothetical protein